MNFISELLSRLSICKKVKSFVDERLKVNSSMSLSDFLEFNYTQMALHSTDLGTSDDVYVPGRQVIVSLTSHGNRILDAYMAIETIMQGTMKPNRIILWLPEHDKVSSCLLENQVKRGLEIRYVKDLGPHTKLIPALREFPEDIIITIDDDIFYKPDMVENLLRAHYHDSSSILANRIAVMTTDKNGNLNSYLKWVHYNYPEHSSKRNVIIGVEGCLYPPHTLSDEIFNEDAIQELCPTADDIWFTAMALLKGTRIAHVDCRYDKGFAGGVANQRMQRSGLVHLNENPRECRNDFQIRAVFDKYNLYPLIG